MLAETGYVMPSNLDVAQQRRLPPDRPAAAALRRVRPRAAPRPAAAQHHDAGPSVRRATAPSLTQLFYDPVIVPLQDRLEAIDAGVGAAVRPVEGDARRPRPSRESLTTLGLGLAQAAWRLLRVQDRLGDASAR